MFRVVGTVSRFSLHFVFCLGNLDYFLDIVQQNPQHLVLGIFRIQFIENPSPWNIENPVYQNPCPWNIKNLVHQNLPNLVLGIFRIQFIKNPCPWNIKNLHSTSKSSKSSNIHGPEVLYCL